MENRKMNKTIAGYHLLMVLSTVDYRFNVHEDLVIKDFLVKEFPFDLNLDKQMETISALTPLDWKSHFHKCLTDFEDDATDTEKKVFMRFAINLVKADKVVTIEENEYVVALYDKWYPQGMS
jgi:hypothetical protein